MVYLESAIFVLVKAFGSIYGYLWQLPLYILCTFAVNY